MLLTYACNVSLHDSDPVKGKDYQHKKHRLQFIIKPYAFFYVNNANYIKNELHTKWNIQISQFYD